MGRRLWFVVVVLLVVVLVVPWLLQERDIPAGVPGPQALDTVAIVELPARVSACFDDAVLDEHSEQARFRVGTYGGPPQPLELEVAGQRVPIAARYADNDTLRVDLRPPSEPVAARVCIRNRGTERVALYGAKGRESGRSPVVVDGEPTADTSVSLSFNERDRVSLAARAGSVLDRMSAFRPAGVGPWLLVLVGVLFAFGVPVLVTRALLAAISADGTSDQAPERR